LSNELWTGLNRDSPDGGPSEPEIAAAGLLLQEGSRVAPIEAFIADDIGTAKSFIWTKTEVRQKRLEPCFVD
jgi:hypothetical protein